MNRISSILAVTTLSLAAPAAMHSAQSKSTASGNTIVQPDGPRAGLLTIVEMDAAPPMIGVAKSRIAWKSLSCLPTGERARLLTLVRAVDRANRPRAPRIRAPLCMTNEY